jgi:CDP-glucose 4,6-dehydratase
VSVRAGNVIGGGDFADNRIIPDLVRGIISGNPVEIRSPESTRPWQHVLDALLGYLLTLEANLDSKLTANVNFSPKDESLSVAEVVEVVKSIWSEIKIEFPSSKVDNYKQFEVESKKLQLDSNLANNLLGWRSRYSQKESIISTIKWWKSYLSSELSAQQLCEIDVADFLKIDVPLSIKTKSN